METLAPDMTTASIAERSSHSQPTFRKLVNSQDGKELRRGAEALKKRVDKHFGDADDPNLSRSLVIKVIKACEERYGDYCTRAMRLNETIYNNEVDMEFRHEEIAKAFAR